ncbi:GyrI-like domain-containing protein [Streptosporangium sandarakinum]
MSLNWYSAADDPEVVEFGPVRALSIMGQGEPGGAVYGTSVGALYAAAGALIGVAARHGRMFELPCLEGRWWVEDERSPFDVPREEWWWHLFLRLPDAAGVTGNGPVSGGENDAMGGSAGEALNGLADKTGNGLAGGAVNGPVDAVSDGPVDATSDGPVGAASDGPVDVTSDGPVDATSDGPVGAAWDDAWVDEAREAARHPAAARVQLVTFTEGLCVQALHRGPYAEEPKTLARMEAHIRDAGFVRNGLHHEIYLSDVRETDPEKMRTILRQPVRSA